MAMPRPCRSLWSVASWPCSSAYTTVSWPISRHNAVSQAPLLVTIQILYRNLTPAACCIAALAVLYHDTASGHTFSAPLSRYNQLYRDTPSQTVRPCCYVTIQCFVSRPHPNGQAMSARPVVSCPLSTVLQPSSRPCRGSVQPYRG